MAEYIDYTQATTLFGDVDARFDTVEGKIPSNASSGNKMVTASDIANKADLVNGLVPANQLPSFVDDVLMGTAQNITETAAGTYSADGFIISGESTPATLEDGKTYVDTATNIQFRYTGTGSNLVSMGSNLALGETATTAYAGNKGKANADAISDIQDLIPSGASTSNKLATASDIPDTSGLQSKTLATTIGSYTTVEGALSGINDGKVDKVTGKGLSTNDYDATAKGIVDGIPLTIQQLQGSLLNKVDKEVGKGLSTNDYDATAKGKVDGMDASIAASQNGSTALTKTTVGWTGKNIANMSNAEIGKAWNGASNTARARLIVRVEPSKNYILSIHGTNILSGVFYGVSASIPPSSVESVSAFPCTIATSATDNFITLGFNKTDITLADLESCKFMLRDAAISNATFEAYHDSVDVCKLNKSDLKTVVAASSDFADFKTRIAAL